MIKIYDFEYDFLDGFCKIEVDLTRFTEEHAKATLDFFTWDYDKEGDIVDEAVKKYGLLVIEKATEGHGLHNLKTNQFEGYVKMDGSFGVTLISVEGYKIDEDLLQVTISTK